MTWYNDYATTYGSKSDYAKSLDAAAKAKLIDQLGQGGNVGRAFKDPTGRGRQTQALYDKLMGKVAEPERVGGKSFGSSGKPATGVQGAAQRKWGGDVEGRQARSAAASASRDEDLINRAYDRALSRGLYSEVQTSADDLKTQNEMNPLAKHERWVRIHDNLSGKDKWVVDNTLSGPEGGLGGNWRRNQAAWQAGIGAVTGLITGGPVGAVAGGLAGYASGKPAQDAQRAAPEPRAGQRPAKGTIMRDVARQRAAGSGVFNYTERAAQ